MIDIFVDGAASIPVVYCAMLQAHMLWVLHGIKESDPEKPFSIGGVQVECVPESKEERTLNDFSERVKRTEIDSKLFGFWLGIGFGSHMTFSEKRFDWVSRRIYMHGEPIRTRKGEIVRASRIWHHETDGDIPVSFVKDDTVCKIEEATKEHGLTFLGRIAAPTVRVIKSNNLGALEVFKYNDRILPIAYYGGTRKQNASAFVKYALGPRVSRWRTSAIVGGVVLTARCAFELFKPSYVGKNRLFGISL